mgnify:CR=1 FL=1
MSFATRKDCDTLSSFALVLSMSGTERTFSAPRPWNQRMPLFPAR